MPLHGGLTLAAVVVALAPACGDGGPTASRPPRTIEVRVLDEANAEGGFGSFSPAEAEAVVGDTIRWVQRGNALHTVTEGVRGAPAPAGFDAILVEPGQTFEVALTEAGTIPYFCRPHPGMEGRILVTR